MLGMAGALAYAGGRLLLLGVFQSGVVVYMMGALLLAVFMALLPGEPEDQEAQGQGRSE